MSHHTPGYKFARKVIRDAKERMPQGLSPADEGKFLADAAAESYGEFKEKFTPTMKRVIKPRTPEELDAIDDGGEE